MKQLLTFLAAILVSVSLSAQVPNNMSYQAVIRDASNKIVQNQSIGMQISVLQGSTSGTSVYTETQTTTSNTNGAISISVGAGSSSDDFNSINWANGPYFIKTEADPTGGNNYTITGTSQLLSVPYAMHSANGIDKIANNGDTMYLSNGNWLIIPGISSANSSAVLYAPTTLSVSDITKTECVASGSVTNDGGLTISARGICWSTDPPPTIFDNKITEGSGTGTFISSITGLTPGTRYYVRAYITNSLNTFYGDAVSFITNSNLPSTYNFENVSYSGQTDRLNMLYELTSYVKTGHKENTTLDADILNSMYANDGHTWSSEAFPNGQPTKDLSSKTYEEARTDIVAMFDSIAKYSGKAGGEYGQAGLVTRADRTILVDANGMEYAQLIGKGLMGSCFYYQGTSKYLSDNKIGDAVDNTTVEDGKGTAKEHHFDEAFGYFGAPIDFPTSTYGASFWAKYCNKMDAVAGTNEIMNSFIKGRTAISNKNKSDQNDAVADIKMQWEKVSAATAIYYLNKGITSFADDANRCHYLSEALAFIEALKYNVDGSINAAKVDEILTALGGDFWNITVTKIEEARNILATAAGLESVKTQL